MADLDQALQDVLNEIGQLPGLITQAVQAAVTAANGGDAAQLQAALQHQQNVADSLEQGVAAIQAAFNVPAPAPAAPISIPPAGAPADVYKRQLVYGLVGWWAARIRCF